MNALKNIKAVVFDAYGTLFDIATIDARLEHYYGDSGPEVAAVWRRKQLEYTWLRTLMDQYRDFSAITADALRFACEQTGVPIAEEQLADLLERYKKLKVYPEVAAALEKMAQTHRLAILSNANPQLLEEAVAFNGMDEHLEAIFSADQIWKYKPFPGIYQIPVQGLNLKKDQIAFVSSNTWDVSGAASFGLQVVWVKRGKGHMEKLGFEPQLVVNDLKELGQQLGGG